jgi:hypothetical protein
MKELLYDYSKQVIKRINLLHKTPELTQVMQTFDVLANGEMYGYLLFLLYATGRRQDFAFLMTCFFINGHVINVLKLLLHETRP